MLTETTFLQKLRKSKLFHGIDAALIHDLSLHISTLTFRRDDMIFHEGSPGDSLFLILSGEVVVSARTPGGSDVLLGTLREDDFFGELDLIDGLRRSARAVASSECSLARLSLADFRNLLASNAQFRENVMRAVSGRLRAANQTYVRHEEENIFELRRQLGRMHRLVEASKTVNSSLEVNTLLGAILRTAISAVGADRGTLYLVDHEAHELWSKAQQGAEIVEIRLPIGLGLAGTVAAGGETINIADAYSDPRFNPDVDKTTGYHTTTVLCMPLKNKKGTTIGVFQMLNKLAGAFTREDEEFIEALSAHASIAVENAQLALQMIQTERLSAVGSMASSIIHDIKNPLGVLRLSAQVIKEKTRDPKIGKLADGMMRQVDRFVAMTQEILDFSRGGSVSKLVPMDLAAAIESSLSFVREDLAGRKIRLTTEIGKGLTVSGDAEKLSRAFHNIIGNAADAMAAGGSLTVRAHDGTGGISVEFADTGCGMPPEVRAKIFQPFVTHGKKHGTGLGMSIVKKIVDDHRGTIDIASEIDKGTTVRITFPAPED